MNNDLLDEMIQLLERGERFALATLVDARGSTPQKAGARLLARADGSATGTLGGGCIEASAREAAAEVLASGVARVLDFELTEDIAVDYGLACGGTERILIVPAGAIDIDVLRALRDAGRRRGAVVTVVRSPDGAAGRTIAVWDGGATDGDAPMLDPDALIAARALIAERHPRPRVVRASSGAEYFIEPRTDAVEVVAVGGGHVGLAVATAARFAGYRVAVIDDRAEFANAERFPDADATVVGDIEQALAAYPSPRRAPSSSSRAATSTTTRRSPSRRARRRSTSASWAAGARSRSSTASSSTTASRRSACATSTRPSASTSAPSRPRRSRSASSPRSRWRASAATARR